MPKKSKVIKKRILIGVSVTIAIILLGIMLVWGISDSNNKNGENVKNTESVENSEDLIIDVSTETEADIDTELGVEIETELNTETELEVETQTENEVVMNDSETKEEPKVESSQKEESPKEEPPKSEEKDVQYDADGRKIYRIIDGINFYADWDYTTPQLAAMDAGFEVLAYDSVSGCYCMLFKREADGNHYAEDFRADERFEEKLLELGLIPRGGSGCGSNCGSGMAGIVQYFDPYPLPTEDAKKKFEDTGEEYQISCFGDGYRYDGKKWIKYDIPSADEYDDYDDLHSFDGSW